MYRNIGAYYLNHALTGEGFTVTEIRLALSGLDISVLRGTDERVATQAIAAINDAIAKEYWNAILMGIALCICGIGLPWKKIHLGQAPTVSSSNARDEEQDHDMPDVSPSSRRQN